MPARTVRCVMTAPVRTLTRNESLDVADDLMTLTHIRHLPVVDDGRVVGVVSQRDLVQRALAAALGYGEVSQKKLLHTLLVKDVMSDPPVLVDPDITVRDAGRLMLERRVGCLPVVEGGSLVGIVTQSDIVRELIAA